MQSSEMHFPEHLHILVPAGTKSRLDEAALEQGRTMSELIRRHLAIAAEPKAERRQNAICSGRKMQRAGMKRRLEESTDATRW
jgi:hypothetical protein